MSAQRRIAHGVLLESPRPLTYLPSPDTSLSCYNTRKTLFFSLVPRFDFRRGLGLLCSPVFLFVLRLAPVLHSFFLQFPQGSLQQFSCSFLTSVPDRFPCFRSVFSHNSYGIATPGVCSSAGKCPVLSGFQGLLVFLFTSLLVFFLIPARPCVALGKSESPAARFAFLADRRRPIARPTTSLASHPLFSDPIPPCVLHR